MPSSILVFGSLILIMISVGYQTTPPFDSTNSMPHPAILDPIVMAKATDSVNSWLGLPIGGESDIARFMSDDYWPFFLGENNSTLFNLTA
jgi:hypothetical protein